MAAPLFFNEFPDDNKTSPLIRSTSEPLFVVPIRNAYHQNRLRCLVQDLVRRRAEKGIPEDGMLMRPHEFHLGPGLRCTLNFCALRGRGCGYRPGSGRMVAGPQAQKQQ